MAGQVCAAQEPGAHQRPKSTQDRIGLGELPDSQFIPRLGLIRGTLLRVSTYRSHQPRSACAGKYGAGKEIRTPAAKLGRLATHRERTR